jgi:hypothetical protein
VCDLRGKWWMGVELVENKGKGKGRRGAYDDSYTAQHADIFRLGGVLRRDDVGVERRHRRRIPLHRVHDVDVKGGDAVSGVKHNIICNKRRWGW